MAWFTLHGQTYFLNTLPPSCTRFTFAVMPIEYSHYSFYFLISIFIINDVGVFNCEIWPPKGIVQLNAVQFKI